MKKRQTTGSPQGEAVRSARHWRDRLRSTSVLALPRRSFFHSRDGCFGRNPPIFDDSVVGFLRRRLMIWNKKEHNVNSGGDVEEKQMWALAQTIIWQRHDGPLPCLVRIVIKLSCILKYISSYKTVHQHGHPNIGRRFSGWTRRGLAVRSMIPTYPRVSITV